MVSVGRPVIGQSDSRAILAKLEPDGDSARNVGAVGRDRRESDRDQVVVCSGDKVIISDMSQYDQIPAMVLG